MATARFNGGQPGAVVAVADPVLRAIGLACTLDEAVRRFRVACFDEVQSGSYQQKGRVSPLPKQAHDPAVRAAVMALLSPRDRGAEAQAA